MAVINVPGGGGMFTGFLPKILGTLGSAALGPIGGVLGAFGGNMLNGQNAGSAALGAAGGAIGDAFTPDPVGGIKSYLSESNTEMPPYTGGPDYTERMEMNKAEAPAVTPRFDALVAQYGAKPEDDWTTRQQVQRGVPDSRTTRFNSWGAPSSAWDKHRGSWR